MGIDLIIAMVAAAAVTHGIEKGKARSREAWDRAKARAEKRGAARERARQARSQEWERRFTAARSAGPSNPLWWPYAAGAVLAGSAAAVAAGAAGAAEGVVAGARGGYRVGREGARKGWAYRDAWREWRRPERDWLDTVQCKRCGGYVTTDQAVETAEYGRVCPDCVPQPTPERDEPEQRRCCHCARYTDPHLLDEDGWCPTCANHEHSGVSGECDGNCRNSDLSPEEAEAHGWCWACGGRRETVTDFGGSHRHVPCDECFGTGRAGADNDHEPPGEPTAPRIYVDSERVDDEGNTKENTMTELMPAGTIGATGEGYTDTIASLNQLAKLLTSAHEEVTNLGDQLTANSLDSDTLGQINDLADMLDSAAPIAQNLAKHVENRHAPVADAVAGAGGSGNVASTTWYDNY